MSAERNRKRQPWLKALFQFAAEHEGRKLGVRILDRNLHTVESGPVGSIVDRDASPDWAIAGYRIRLSNASGQWYEYEFDLAGKVRSERKGTQLEAD